MEVVRIAKKTTENFINKSSLYHLGTDLNKLKSFKSGKNTPPWYRLLLLLDGIKSNEGLYQQSTDLFWEKHFSEILAFFLNKYSGKVIYGLSNLKFSSFSELSRILNLKNMTSLRDAIFRMEQFRLIAELSRNAEDFKIIKTFWKREYPTGATFPKLFYLQHPFDKIAEAFADPILKRYITKREFNEILTRRKRFEEHYKVVNSQLKLSRKRDAGKLGNCYACSRVIIKGAIKGKDYHQYPIGMVCGPCNSKATKQEIGKWIHSNK